MVRIDPMEGELFQFKTKINGVVYKKRELDDKLSSIEEKYKYYTKLDSRDFLVDIHKFLRTKYLEEIWYTEEPPTLNGNTQQVCIKLYDDEHTPYELAVEYGINQFESLVLRNLDEAMIFLFQQDKMVDFALVKELHKLILKDIETDKEKIGQFARNGRKSADGYPYTDPRVIETNLRNLLKIVNQSLDSAPNDFLNLVKTATYFLNRFLKIHPFHDGNGRVARLLFSYLLRRHIIPPVSLVNQCNRDKFQEVLTKANDSHVQIQTLYPLLEFVTNRLVETLSIIQDFAN